MGFFGNIFKGWFGETKATFNMWLSLDDQIYQRFHDTILPSANGTAQVDHIIVSPYGIFIVETKNKDGWIFGDEKQPKWTQVIYGKKYSLQNPLRQAFRQKKVLAQFLSVDEKYIQIVIYFNGDCRFKTEMPPNVINSGLGWYIKSFSTQVLSQADVFKITQKIIKHKTESNISHTDHLRSLHERHSSSTTCPRCGGNLKLKEVRSGHRAGSKFLGCDNYPRCRFAKNA